MFMKHFTPNCMFDQIYELFVYVELSQNKNFILKLDRNFISLAMLLVITNQVFR